LQTVSNALEQRLAYGRIRESKRLLSGVRKAPDEFAGNSINQSEGR